MRYGAIVEAFAMVIAAASNCYVLCKVLHDAVRVQEEDPSALYVMPNDRVHPL